MLLEIKVLTSGYNPNCFPGAKTPKEGLEDDRRKVRTIKLNYFSFLDADNLYFVQKVMAM